MDHEGIFTAAADQRRGIADLLDALDDEQLASPSLCAGWDVKTVASHLVGALTDNVGEFLFLAVRRGGFHRASDELSRRRARLPAVQIADLLRRHADRRLNPPVTGPLAPLTDVVVHDGDMRIPLGLPFAPEPARVVAALDFLTGPRPFGFVPRSRLRGISLQGTDHDRRWGRGAEMRGPLAALMMAAAGRPAALDSLCGPGLDLLRDRLATDGTGITATG